MSEVSENIARNSELYKKVEHLLDFEDFVTLTSAVVENGYFDKFENTIHICHDTGNKEAMAGFLEAQMDRYKIM